MNKTHYTYILRSTKDQGLYIGETANLKVRLQRHQAGEVISTRFHRPLKLVYYECFISRKDAKARERYLKSGYGREQIKIILRDTLGY